MNIRKKYEILSDDDGMILTAPLLWSHNSPVVGALNSRL